MRNEGMKSTVTFTDTSKRFSYLIENSEVGKINYYSALTGGSMPNGYIDE
jgi:hypothetical protein